MESPFQPRLLKKERAAPRWVETLLLLCGAVNFLYFIAIKFASFDKSQRVAVGIALVSLAFLVTQTLYNRRTSENV